MLSKSPSKRGRARASIVTARREKAAAVRIDVRGSPGRSADHVEQDEESWPTPVTRVPDASHVHLRNHNARQRLETSARCKRAASSTRSGRAALAWWLVMSTRCCEDPGWSGVPRGPRPRTASHRPLDRRCTRCREAPVPAHGVSLTSRALVSRGWGETWRI